jgi:uncharacterized protein (DUF2384 family)
MEQKNLPTPESKTLPQFDPHLKAIKAEPVLQCPVTSDEIYERYRHFVARAVDVFGDDLVANRWLTTRQPELGDRSPLEVAQSEDFCTGNLDQILGRLEHGVFA